MLIAALALAAVLGKPPGAHFVDWSAPGLVVTQKGIAIGTPRKDERLILFFKDGTCSHVQTYTGRYGDEEKAWAFVAQSKFCAKNH
jgi:hypothetical protein